MKSQDLSSNVQLASAIVAILLGGATIIAFLYRRYQATLGRRRILTARLRRLSCNMQLSYLEYVLGVPAFRRNDEWGTVYIWTEPEYYIQALVRDEVTAVLSITTRTRRFKPTLFKGHIISLDGESLQVRVGKTTFSRLPGGPQGIRGFVGARRWSYSELYYYGNPGNYQYYIYSLNDAGFIGRKSWPLIHEVAAKMDVSLGALAPSGRQDSDVSQFLSQPKVIQARRRARLNTMTTTAPFMDLAELPSDFEFGPDYDYVRLVQRSQSLARLRMWARSVRARIEAGSNS